MTKYNRVGGCFSCNTWKWKILWPMFSLLGSQRVPYIFFTPTFIALINYWKLIWCLTVVRGFQVLPTFFSDMYSELLSKDRGICTFAIEMSKVKLPSPSLTAGKLIALDNVAVQFCFSAMVWFYYNNFKQHCLTKMVVYLFTFGPIISYVLYFFLS